MRMITGNDAALMPIFGSDNYNYKILVCPLDLVAVDI